jgi:hypothetical protein
MCFWYGESVGIKIEKEKRDNLTGSEEREGKESLSANLFSTWNLFPNQFYSVKA